MKANRDIGLAKFIAAVLVFLTILMIFAAIPVQAAPGTLTVVASPGQVNMYVDGVLMGTTGSSQGSVSTLVDGTYWLKLSKDGYKDWVKQITVTTGSTTIVYAYLETGYGNSTTRNEVISPSSSSSYGSLNLKTGANVAIYVNGEYEGSSNSWGDQVTVSGITSGTYWLRLAATNCKDWVKQVVINPAASTKLWAYLEPGYGNSTTRTEIITPASSDTYGTLVIDTDANVGIYVNGEYEGTSNSWGDEVTISGIMSGTYSLRLSASNCKDWSKQIVISPFASTKLWAHMEPGYGSTTTRAEIITPTSTSTYGTLVLNTGSEVDIFVNGEYEGATNSWGDQVTILGIVNGTYTLELSASGCKDWTKTVQIEPAASTEIWAYLEPGTGTSATRNEALMPASTALYGTLVLNSGSNVAVYLDGEYEGSTNSWGDPLTASGILSGTYIMKLSASGYRDETQSVVISPSQTTTVSLTLRPLDEQNPSPTPVVSASPTPTFYPSPSTTGYITPYPTSTANPLFQIDYTMITIVLMIIIISAITVALAATKHKKSNRLQPLTHTQIIICRKCGYANPPDYDFCGQCGSALRD